MSDLLRMYEGRPLNSFQLPFLSFQELLSSKKDDPSLFLTFYDDGKKKSEMSFADFFLNVQRFSEIISSKLASDFNGHIAVALQNSPEALVSYCAVMNLGLTLIPIDPQQTEDFYLRIAKSFDCRYVVVSGEHVARKCFDFYYDYDQKEKRKEKEQNTFAGGASQVIFTSSGTTGAPKGIVQSFHSLIVNSIATAKMHSLEKKTKHMCVLPLFHVNAFSFSFFTSLFNGSQLILNRNFSQAHFFQVANETSPQIISVIPPMIRLLTEDPREFFFPKSLGYFVCAASHLSKKNLLEFYQKFNVPIFQAYGLSEAVNFSTTFPPSTERTSYEEILKMDEKVPIGIEVWGNHLEILDANEEIVLSEKIEGEIVIRGWNLMEEYYHSFEKTKEAFSRDYFHTGDVGYFKRINGKKFYYLTGRKKEIAKVNGKQIYLNEIDEAIIGLKYVREVCSVCYLDEKGEEQIGIYLVLKEKKELETIRLDCKNLFLKEVAPGKIVLGEQLLLTASGKKCRQEMSRRYF